MQSLLPAITCQQLAAAAARARSALKLAAVHPLAFRLAGQQNLHVLAVVRRFACSSPAVSKAASARTDGSSQQQQQQQRSQDSAAAAAEGTFYAESAESFADLGLAPALVQALQAAGFVRPSKVQELVTPKVLTGRDIVLAAETGSGKTLAYIAPLASMLLQRAAAGQHPPPPQLLKEDGGSSHSSTYKPKDRPPARWMGLVLCPNAALCHQVVRLVSSLPGPNGSQPLLRACHVSSSSPPPADPADIVVTTPGALKTLFNDRGAMYGSDWTAEAVAARSAFVVVDEADLLWQGGYVKDLTRLLDAFKAAERRLLEAQVLQELGLGKGALNQLPRTVRAALWKGGAPAMFKAGLTQHKLQQLRAGQQPQRQQQQQQEQQEQLEDSGLGQAAAGASAEASSSSGRDEDRASSSQAASTSGSGQQYGPYYKRQHLFVAATMPALTKGDVGMELQKRFPDGLWVSGELLHQVQPHVDHTWVRVGKQESDIDAALLAAIQSDPDYMDNKARILVFTRNTASADRVCEVLQANGVSTYTFHKNMPQQDQSAALSAMAHPEPRANLVMVSTDAAARGIDLPQVTHIIQADFVANAIEFLHRVGRTARAGNSGKVTSLYGPADAVLADAVRAYVEAGQPVEDCFSRNRSFSRKVKRYGKFVPRGQEGPQPY